ncbi:MAG TPA: RagB/SusD family nutrient uptake outer membrane protein [Gemmatimonadaceae bacterium]
MKRLLTFGAALALVIGTMSCVDLTEKLVSGISSQYYATPDGLTAAANSMYSQLRGHWGREESAAITQLGVDTWANGDQVAAGAQAWFYFNDYSVGLNSADSRLSATWNSMYQLINTANSVLDRGPSTQGVDPAIKASRLGEAHFIRALAYFQLVRTWGGVTLNLHEAQGVVDTASRAAPADVYTAIINDLDTAITQLPVKQSDYGRATLGAAQDLLAKVYLTRAYQSYGKGQADFQQALTLAKTVINSGTYTLVPAYADLWCVNRASDPNRQGWCEVNGLNEGNSEVIFPVQYSTDPTQFTVNFGNYLHLEFLSNYDGGTAVEHGMTRDIPNGRPFRRMRPTAYEEGLWSDRWLTPSAPTDTFNGTQIPANVLDTRYDGSFQTLWIVNTAAAGNPSGAANCPKCTSGAALAIGDTALFMPGYQVTDAQRLASKYVILTPCRHPVTANCGRQNSATVNPDAYAYDWQYYPSLKKFQDDTRPSVAGQDGSKDIYLLRLGETYLIAAEADVELGNTAEAASFVNVIRERAGSTGHKALMDVTSAQMTLDFIMDERERELGGEINRWYDITRPGAAFFVNRVKLYNPDGAPNVQAFQILRPIPQSQIDLTKGGYPQNPGY